MDNAGIFPRIIEGYMMYIVDIKTQNSLINSVLNIERTTSDTVLKGGVMYADS